MYLKRSLLLILVVYTNSVLAVAKDRLVVATALWEPNYTTEEGNGIYQQIVNKVYEDFAIHYEYASYTRSKALVKEGKADLWLAAYAEEEDYALYPTLPFDGDMISLVGLPSQTSVPEDLGTLSVAWVTGYQLQRYFDPPPRHYYEVESTDAALRMLLAKRIDYVIDESWNLEHQLAEDPSLQKRLRIWELAILPVYPAFQKNASGESLRELWDQRMRLLFESGWLQQLYQQMDVEYRLTSCLSEDAKGEKTAITCLRIKPDAFKTPLLTKPQERQ
ncbi:transporter substrate-binding domain-containing protein [Aliiglaciecola sp. CAU 1673]|uniref:substrate-binding periplasmic protein n=1 Tax=Aliiglaciecola sp. CAU 1673 TaxID=3032595 RepID=UPI0023DAC653|nr:transporter substrate-binding domain-containing protein [Aliiglaciecola sp. CAU 1673]MDF2178929.1 transporter substrate-binding domain-containing protein [Aliiglaciecola sp. CAU 1673]